MLAENREMGLQLKNAKNLIKGVNNEDISSDTLNRLKSFLLERIQAFEDFELHYVKKENVLFPFLKKTGSSAQQ